MRIELISEEQYNLLLQIAIEYPKLVFQNIGYKYLNKNTFTESEKEAFAKVTEILKKHIVGFVEFNNFQYNKKYELKLRFQYNYGAADNSMPFTGVGYLLLEELYKGFKD